MTAHPVIRAATALAEVLERENARLAALDLAVAGRLLAEKESAVAAFRAAQAEAGGGLPAEALEAARAIGLRLRDLAAENRRLLERGMAAQGRVVAVIARAARRAPSGPPRYAASGRLSGPRTPLPLAISARV